MKSADGSACDGSNVDFFNHDDDEFLAGTKQGARGCWWWWKKREGVDEKSGGTMKIGLNEITFKGEG